jgi:hypothetical protein
MAALIAGVGSMGFDERNAAGIGWDSAYMHKPL